MAAKDLGNAIRKAVVGGLVVIHQNVRNEIRDMLAHEVMKFSNRELKIGYSLEMRRAIEDSLTKLFKKVVGEK